MTPQFLVCTFAIACLAMQTFALNDYGNASAVKHCAGRGGCDCDCSWATSSTCAHHDDGSCCFGCCCGSGPTPSPPGPPPPTPTPSTLEATLQKVMTDLANEVKAFSGKDVAFQLGWKSNVTAFTVAAGKINVPSCPSRDVIPEDTFTYGSGTKPVTAAAVMRYIDAGVIHREDKLHTHIDAYLHRNAGTSLAQLYGSAADDATVLQILRMSAGIPDFENGNVDEEILNDASRVWSPYEFLQRAKSFPMPCKPGECSAYSSTSFELAGILLAALQGPSSNWTEFDMRVATFPDSRYKSLSFPAADGKIADTVTVPALTDRGAGWPDNVVIRDQNPSILGWTCGNMVGNSGDVAAFYYDLLAPTATSSERIISDVARAEMCRFELQTKGWGAGWLSYGAGLMEQVGREGASQNSSSPSGPDDWNYYLGHGGLTYGYSAEQGYIPKMAAAFAVVANTDHQEFVFSARCRLFEAAAKFLKDEDIYFNCKRFDTRSASAAPSLDVIV